MTTNTKAMPDGYHSLTPAITVGDAAKAIEFYKRAFAAQEKERFLGPDGRIMHAEVKIGDSLLMMGEEMPQMGCLSPLSLKGTPGSLYLYVEDVDAVFERAVQAGAQVQMPVADMFWGDRCGTLADPFGHKWSIATHKEDLTSEEIKRRGRIWMEKQKQPAS